MCETQEPITSIGQLRARLQQGNLDDVAIFYRVAGGMPGDNRIEEELQIASDGVVTARVARSSAPPEIATGVVEPREFEAVLRLIERDVGRWIPQSEARFVPDSTVGSITVNVGGEGATYYFLVDEEAQQDQARSIESEEPNAENTLAGILRRLVETKGE